MTELAMLAVQ